MLAAALAARFAPLVPVGVALLGAEYALLLVSGGEALDTRAAFVAAALLGVAEVSYWALELREAVADEPGLVLRRVALLSGLALLTVATGLGLLTLVELAGTEGRALELAGAVAAVVALALLAATAHRERTKET
ncbi:MAG TPA: hypothetical protein VNT23_09290 [Gaiellaceae bacterium]|nr:hypothetical protein [Gaiellaceae bacterium]